MTINYGIPQGRFLLHTQGGFSWQIRVNFRFAVRSDECPIPKLLDSVKYIFPCTLPWMVLYDNSGLILNFRGRRTWPRYESTNAKRPKKSRRLKKTQVLRGGGKIDFVCQFVVYFMRKINNNNPWILTFVFFSQSSQPHHSTVYKISELQFIRFHWK